MISSAKLVPCLPALVLTLGLSTAHAIEIAVDFTYDTNGFFDTPEKRDAMQAAADRFSAVVTSSLLPVFPEDSEPGWRIGFPHPATGESFEISTAASAAEDPIGAPADEYGFPGLPADTWILYAGGRSLGTSAGIGGTATGTNFTTVFDDPEGPLHRGLIPNNPDNSVGDLPVWGGSIAFSTETTWHFDTATTGPLGSTDFYSIALHEIGHALGLNTNWNQWAENTQGNQFLGAKAVEAYNADNSASETSLSLASAGDSHWQDDLYDSIIFPAGNPIYLGTVGAGNPQDLLMEPTANFTATLRRFELTNVDAAALEELGWTIVEPDDSLDLDGDGLVGAGDLDLACAAGQNLAPWFDSLNSLRADADLDGQVQFSDFVLLADHFANAGKYTEGDFDCDGNVQFGDFVILADNFGSTASAVAARVPEPSGIVLCVLSAWAAVLYRRRHRS